MTEEGVRRTREAEGAEWEYRESSRGLPAVRRPGQHRPPLLAADPLLTRYGAIVVDDAHDGMALTGVVLSYGNRGHTRQAAARVVSAQMPVRKVVMRCGNRARNEAHSCGNRRCGNHWLTGVAEINDGNGGRR
uniref:Uncharacterized protein n=1 Tax=Oryza nivara TaxID=4536 RepID=A0A0E0HA61_ORYNI